MTIPLVLFPRKCCNLEILLCSMISQLCLLQSLIMIKKEHFPFKSNVTLVQTLTWSKPGQEITSFQFSYLIIFTSRGEY